MARKLSAGMIYGAITVVILASVLFSVISSSAPTAVDAFYNMTSTLAGKTTELGTGPANFFGNLNTYGGWFLAVGALSLAIYVFGGMLKGRR